MKLNPTVIALTGGAAVALLLTVVLSTAEDSHRAFPSRFLPLDGNTASLAFVLRPIEDLRVLFCDQEVLKGRIRRGVCAVDFGFGGTPFEADIGKGTKLSTLSQTIDKSRWHRGRRQIRVVARNAIYQSALGDTGLADRDAFLATMIMPGDIVVFPYIE